MYKALRTRDGTVNMFMYTAFSLVAGMRWNVWTCLVTYVYMLHLLQCSATGTAVLLDHEQREVNKIIGNVSQAHVQCSCSLQPQLWNFSES